MNFQQFYDKARALGLNKGNVLGSDAFVPMAAEKWHPYVKIIISSCEHNEHFRGPNFETIGWRDLRNHRVRYDT